MHRTVYCVERNYDGQSESFAWVFAVCAAVPPMAELPPNWLIADSIPSRATRMPSCSPLSRRPWSSPALDGVAREQQMVVAHSACTKQPFGLI